MRALVLRTAAALLAFGAAEASAHADDGEWHAGVTLGYASLSRSEAPGLDGMSAALSLRYGAHEAIDLFVEAEASGYPAGATVLGGSAGALYVIDVSRFVPMFGVGLGAVDLATLSCPPTILEDGSEGAPAVPCGHALRPTLSIPFAFDVRVAGPLLLGVHGRFAFLLGSPAAQQLTAGAHAGLAF
jgi:hypothetical protein